VERHSCAAEFMDWFNRDDLMSLGGQPSSVAACSCSYVEDASGKRWK